MDLMAEGDKLREHLHAYANGVYTSEELVEILLLKTQQIATELGVNFNKAVNEVL